VLVSVGRLVEGKGFHRVIECLPALRERLPDLHYLIVGGAGPHDDVSKQLERQVDALGLREHVHFLGEYPPDRLRLAYSAADVFVLATGYEGWANVFLEAMACGLPVVTTRVGGNTGVVSSPDLGYLTELGDRDGLARPSNRRCCGPGTDHGS
jgi:glycosyltransferase involved in cell wall biosynthesis